MDKIHAINSKIYTIKSNLDGQNTYYKKCLRWIKYIMEKETWVNQIYTAKNSLAGQIMYCKKELRWTKYILKKVASVDKIYIIKSRQNI